MIQLSMAIRETVPIYFISKRHNFKMDCHRQLTQWALYRSKREDIWNEIIPLFYSSATCVYNI